MVQVGIEAVMDRFRAGFFYAVQSAVEAVSSEGFVPVFKTCGVPRERSAVRVPRNSRMEAAVRAALIRAAQQWRDRALLDQQLSKASTQRLSGERLSRRAVDS